MIVLHPNNVQCLATQLPTFDALEDQKPHMCHVLKQG